MTKRKSDIDEARRTLLMGGAVLAIGSWLPDLSLAASQPATPASTQKTSKGAITDGVMTEQPVPLMA